MEHGEEEVESIVLFILSGKTYDQAKKKIEVQLI